MHFIGSVSSYLPGREHLTASFMEELGFRPQLTILAYLVFDCIHHLSLIFTIVSIKSVVFRNMTQNFSNKLLKLQSHVPQCACVTIVADLLTVI